MDNKVFLKNTNIGDLAFKLHRLIQDSTLRKEARIAPVLKIYGIPRGGIPAAYALKAISQHGYVIVDAPATADIFIDDIVDSGTTKNKYAVEYPETLFFALIDKQREPDDKWYVFPWEHKAGNEHEGVTDNIQRIIQYIGEDVTRGGLKETPARVQKALTHWFSGYKFSDSDIEKQFKAFEDGAEDYDQMIVRRDIPFYSHCEHHMAAIFGNCTVAYIPKDKVLGLSKMDRIVEIFARRLQVQERLTSQIADTMWKYLDPVGVGVYINARHMCIESRGVCNQNSETITTALRGTFKNEPDCKAEFLNICKP